MYSVVNDGFGYRPWVLEVDSKKKVSEYVTLSIKSLEVQFSHPKVEIGCNSVPSTNQCTSNLDRNNYNYSINLFINEDFKKEYPRTEDRKHEQQLKDKIKNESTRRQIKRTKIVIINANKATLTATILDWLNLTHLHTDSVAWNHFMRMINGNIVKARKVKDFVDVMYQNLPGVLGATTLGTQIESIVSRMNPDVLFIGEADSDEVKDNVPDGYAFVGGTLKTKKEIIRVSVIVKDTIPFKVFKVDTLVPAVGIKIGEWNIIGVYREWSMCGDQSTKSREQQIDRLKDFVEYWLTIRSKSIVAGDFNFDPESTTEYQRSLESIRTCVNDTILPAGWRQIIRGHTRSEANQEAALLDHIYTTAVDCTERTWNQNCSGYDHNLVGVRIKSQGKIFRAETFEYRDLKNVTVKAFEEAWNKFSPEDIFNEKDPSEAVRIWEHKVHLTLEEVAPLKRVTTKPKNNPWMTRELMKLCDQRDLMRKEAYLYKTPEAINRYKRFRNLVTGKLNKARFDWRREHLTISDSRKWWARVKRLAGMVKVNGEDMVIKTEDGKEITTPEELSEYMNQFFKTKVTKLQAKLKIDRSEVIQYATEYMQDKGFERRPEFKFRTVGTGDVSKTVKNLRNTGAQGRDQISTAILKQFRNVLAPSLRHLVNSSIRTGLYPEPWKTGIITPLPKSGDLSVPKNWRPVVINPAVSKVLEGVLQKQLQSYMEENDLYSCSQHAYRPNRSCESALIELDTIVQKSRNEGKIVALVLTDMSAAFNLIKKEVLVSQLEVYGFDEKSRKLVTSYLSKRKTKCKVKGCISGEIELDSGVGEGSVLGPGFFICGMCSVSVVAKKVRQEMAESGFWVEAWTLEFADDTSGVIVAEDEAELQIAIHLMMERFRHYFNSMGMCLNESKCELIVFRSSAKVFDQTLPGGQKEVTCVRLLGLWIDSDYRFGTHTDKVLQKLRFKIANLNRVRKYLEQNKARQLTESLVISTIAYMGTLYLRLPTNQKRVQKMMNSAARSVLQCHPRTHVVEMLRELYWLNSPNLWEYLMVCVMRRLKEGLLKAPVSYNELFIIKDQEMQRLRNARDLKVQWTKMQSHGLNSFLHNACLAFNKYRFATEYFEDEEEFKKTAKLRVFSRNVNGNVT